MRFSWLLGALGASLIAVVPFVGVCAQEKTGAGRSASQNAEELPGLPPEGTVAGEEDGIVPLSDVPPPPRAVFVDRDCDFDGWVGKPLDEAAIKALERPYRILLPDSVMTMDANPARVNVVHEKGGKVIRVWCG